MLIRVEPGCGACELEIEGLVADVPWWATSDSIEDEADANDPELHAALRKSLADTGPLRVLRATEYFTAHSEGCDGKCGKHGFSSNPADYCEDQRRTLGVPSAVEALEEITFKAQSAPNNEAAQGLALIASRALATTDEAS